jgi:hypothetical protein
VKTYVSAERIRAKTSYRSTVILLSEIPIGSLLTDFKFNRIYVTFKLICMYENPYGLTEHNIITFRNFHKGALSGISKMN